MKGFNSHGLYVSRASATLDRSTLKPSLRTLKLQQTVWLLDPRVVISFLYTIYSYPFFFFLYFPYIFSQVIFSYFYIVMLLQIITKMAVYLLSITTKLFKNKPATYIFIDTNAGHSALFHSSQVITSYYTINYNKIFFWQVSHCF